MNIEYVPRFTRNRKVGKCRYLHEECATYQDVIFISSYAGVRGILRNVAPGEKVYFEATSTPRARYFLKENAGEASDVNTGDGVSISGLPTARQLT